MKTSAVARKYRIGLLVDSLDVPVWVRDLALWAAAHPALELAATIVVPTKGRDPVRSLQRLERALLSCSPSHRDHLSLHSIRGGAPVEVGLRPRPSDPQGHFDIDGKELQRLQELGLDLLVRCARGVPTGSALNCSRDGVVGVFMGQERLVGPDRAGLSEVLTGRPATAFTIERLNVQGRPADVLFRGSVATELFHTFNQAALLSRAFPYLHPVLERIARGEASECPDQGDADCEPAHPGVLTYAARTAQRALKKGLRRWTGREFHWQVAFVRQPWWESDFAAGTVIPNPRGAFLADPFTINFQGVDYIFVEEFPFDTRKGVISAYRLDGNEPTRIGVVLEEDHHLSFPFLLEYDGEIYMMPESGADRSVKLYKCVRFPDQWTEAKVLMSGIPGVDSVMLEHDQRWWLLSTIQGAGPALNNAELHAFSADNPLGDWQPHSGNPVVMNATSGRNGGFVRDSNGRPCRVAQLPGFTFYGAGSSIFRIDDISERNYQETLTKSVRPDFFPALDGTHHVHGGPEITVYDFMRVERPS